MRLDRSFGRWWRGCLAAGALLAAALPGGARVCGADSLQQQLRDAAPQILRGLLERQCVRVGVLKFRVQTPGEPARDASGTLNMFLAERLEAALALANPEAPAPHIELARQASLTAAEIPGASHLQEAARRLLFSRRYPPAWGAEPLELDAFVTGVALFARDRKSFRLAIMVVRKAGTGLELLVPPLNIPTTAAIHHENGDSFQVRSVPGRPASQDPAVDVQRVRRETRSAHPLIDNPAVALRIYYDGALVPLTFRDGAAWIPEPRENQRVTMELERAGGAAPLGVVLKVNGENTLYRQRLRDADCMKWVLTPDKPRGAILGYSLPGGEFTAQFRIASRAESKELEMHYGADVGAISLAVFAESSAAEELPAPAPLPPTTPDSLDALAVLKAHFPSAPADDAAALKTYLRGAAQETRTRGVLAAGTPIRQRVEFVDYNWHAEPFMSATIYYYQPQGGR